jgi:hypothetical protein
MSAARRRPVRDRSRPAPRLPAVEDTVRRVLSPTAVAAEALRTGVLPVTAGGLRKRAAPDAETIRVGDPDDDTLANEYVGEQTPGGSTPTPDQNGVDEIGRAYGLQEEDSGSLRSAGEVLSRRDRHRSELRAPRTRLP